MTSGLGSTFTVTALVVSGMIAACPSFLLAQQSVEPRLLLHDSTSIPSNAERQSPAALTRISAFAVSHAGVVVVADNRLQSLRAYRLTGELIAEGSLAMSRTGGRLAANAIAVDELGRIFVYDQLSQSIHRFVLRGRVIAEDHQFATGVRGVRLCAFGGKVYLLGLHDGRTVQQFDARGRRIRSFGNPLGSTPAAGEAIIAAGSSFVCVPERGMVLVAHNVAPIVEAFDSAGQSLWRFASPAFKQLPIRSRPDGSVSFSRGPDPIDALRSVFLVGSQSVGIQVARGGKPDTTRGRSWTLETTYLRIADGSAIGIQSDLVDVVGATPSAVLTVSSAGASLFAWQFAFRGGAP